AAHLGQSRLEEAVLWLEKARIANPEYPVPHPWIASAYSLQGEDTRAANELTEARSLAGDDRASSITGAKATVKFGVWKVRGLSEAANLAGLRKAGMPEE